MGLSAAVQVSRKAGTTRVFNSLAFHVGLDNEQDELQSFTDLPIWKVFNRWARFIGAFLRHTRSLLVLAQLTWG